MTQPFRRCEHRSNGQVGLVPPNYSSQTTKFINHSSLCFVSVSTFRLMDLLFANPRQEVLSNCLPQLHVFFCCCHRMAWPETKHRRPLPVPHKNFRIIFLSTGSPVNRARDEHRSFGIGECTVVWWRPASVSVPRAVAEAVTVAKGRTGDRDLTMDSCRNEILQELVCSTAAGDCRISCAQAGVEVISENFAR